MCRDDFRSIGVKRDTISDLDRLKGSLCLSSRDEVIRKLIFFYDKNN